MLVTFQRNNVNLKMTDGTQIGAQTATESTEKGTEKGTENGSENSTEKGTLKTRHVIVEQMRKNPNVTIAEIAAIVHTSTRNVEKHIYKLQKKGIVRRVGGDRGGYWEIIE